MCVQVSLFVCVSVRVSHKLVLIYLLIYLLCYSCFPHKFQQRHIYWSGVM
jgi:hypothetical protein